MPAVSLLAAAAATVPSLAGWTAAASAPAQLPGRDVRALVAFTGALIAGTDDGLLRSTDGGHSWTPAAGVPADADVNAVAVVGPRVVVATSNGVWSSTDGAAFGSPALLGERLVSVTGVGSSILVGAGEGDAGGGVQRSDDGGAGYSPASVVPAVQGLPGSEVDALAAPGAVVAGTLGHGAWRSTDGGRTFTATGPAAVSVSALLDAGGVVLMGTDEGLLQSTDGGRDWSPVTLPESDAWIRTLQVDATGRPLVGTETGAVYRLDAGAVATLATGLSPVHSLLPLSRGALLVGTFDGLVCVGCPVGAPATTAGGGSAATRPAGAASSNPGAAAAGAGATTGPAGAGAATVSTGGAPATAGATPGASAGTAPGPAGIASAARGSARWLVVAILVAAGVGIIALARHLRRRETPTG